DGAVTEIVGGAMDVAALEAAASQPKGEPVAVVVAAIFALGDGQAAEFTGPEDDGVVEETALFEIEDEGGAGLVGHFAEAAKSFRVFVVSVPGLAVEENLDEANALLDEAAGHEATPG